MRASRTSFPHRGLALHQFTPLSGAHRITPILIVAAAVLAGCQSRSPVHPHTAAPTVPAPLPFRPMLMTSFGTNTSSDGSWRIGVSERSLDLSRSAAAHGEGWTSSGWTTTGFGTASPWTTHAGWFVFAESESRVWAFDGDRLLILKTYVSNGRNSSSAIYDHRFPCAVPAEVFSRLPERKQKEVQTRERVP
jgi:hypothetical protein